jgi:glucose-6-phosphate 1-dehydrogenase
MKVPDNSNLVIFGASGDLTFRKLVPALYHLFQTKQLPDCFFVLGVGRSEFSDEAFRERLAVYLRDEYALSDQDLSGFLPHLHYLALDTQNAQAYASLKHRLDVLYEHYNTPHNTLFYLATPPSLFPIIPRCLAAHGLHEEHSGWKRLIVEKPIGYDLKSAIALDDALHEVFREEQIYRIDHYLGKETVQNLLVF